MNAAGLGLGMLVVLFGAVAAFAVGYAIVTRIELGKERLASLRGDAENRVLRRELAKQTGARLVVNDLVANDIDDPGWTDLVNRIRQAGGVEGQNR